MNNTERLVSAAAEAVETIDADELERHAAQRAERIRQTRAEFLWGFALGAGLDRTAADAHWAEYSRALSDSERERDEAQGRDRGFEMGSAWASLV